MTCFCLLFIWVLTWSAMESFDICAPRYVYCLVCEIVAPWRSIGTMSLLCTVMNCDFVGWIVIPILSAALFRRFNLWHRVVRELAKTTVSSIKRSVCKFPSQLSVPQVLTASIVGSIYAVNVLQLLLPPCFTPCDVLNEVSPIMPVDFMAFCSANKNCVPNPLWSRYSTSFYLWTLSYAFW